MGQLLSKNTIVINTENKITNIEIEILIDEFFKLCKENDPDHQKLEVIIDEIIEKNGKSITYYDKELLLQVCKLGNLNMFVKLEKAGDFFSNIPKNDIMQCAYNIGFSGNQQLLEQFYIKFVKIPSTYTKFNNVSPPEINCRKNLIDSTSLINMELAGACGGNQIELIKKLIESGATYCENCKNKKHSEFKQKLKCVIS